MRGPGGPSRASSGVPIRTPGAVTAGRRTVLPSQERRRVPGPKTVECHAAGFALTWRGRPPGRARSKPIKHRARDALGLADLRHALPFRSNQSGRRAHRTSTRLDVARRRGPRVQLDPGVPRALGWGGRQKEQGRRACRGLDKEYGRWRLRCEMPHKAVSGITTSCA